MNNEERDELWDLLGKARQPAVSPFFARNVVREVRALKVDQNGGFWLWLKRCWPIPTVAFCAVLIAGANFIHSPKISVPEEQQVVSIAESVSESPDYQVIAHLDELLDAEQSSVWLDSKVY